MLPNADLELALLEGLSSREIARRFLNIGKTTVAKHRRECMGVYVPSDNGEEHQSINWSGSSGVWNTGSLDSALTGISHEAILAKFGHNPDEVAIKGVLRESHKEYWSRDLEKMLWKHSYSYSVEKKSGVSIEEIDAVALLNDLSASKDLNNVYWNREALESTFVLDWADWQMGKKEGDGSKGLLVRLDSAFSSGVKRIRELRNTGRELDELVIIGGGDMIEGCVIYPNQSYEIDANRREQIRTTSAAILQGICTFAPLFKSVRVVVAPGNHGEHRIAGNRTMIGDNDDLLVFEIAQMACESNPNLQHVSFEIAEREISVTTQIQGWIYGITHGDVYGRGSGTGVRNKVFGWFKTMAANRHPVGMSDVLVTHHFHHDAMEDWGNTLWIQNPTIDGGSHYFKEYSGHDTKPGMNSWVVTAQERLQDKQILR
jgi:hypothetical protein